MRMKASKKGCFFYLLVLLYAFGLKAQDSIVGLKPKNDFLLDLDKRNWQVKIPLWIPGFRGNFAYGSITPVPEQYAEGHSDRLEKEIGVTFYLIGNLRYTPKKWLFEADGFKAVLASNLKFQNIDLVQFNATIEGMVLRGFTGYKVFESSNPEKYFNFKVYPYVGVRYFDAHAFSENRNLLDIEPSWVEPIVGISLPLRIKRWQFKAQFDVGGFGIDKHWSTHGSLSGGYRFSKLFAVGLGWSALDFNYSQEYKGYYLDFDIALSGPVFSLQLTF